MNKDNFINWVKVHIKLIIFLFIIFYIIIPLSPFIVSPIGIFSKDNATLFINYYGAIVSGIIGGALTLGGVWWTIKEQKKDLKEEQIRLDEQRREDLAIQYKPIFSLEFSHSLIYNFPFDNACISFYLTFKNIGRGEANNIDTKYPRSILPYAFMASYEENQIIVPNSSCYLMITISKTGKPTGEDTYEMVPLDLNNKIELPFSIKFNDSFGNQYIYDYTVSFAYQTIIDSQEIKSYTLKDSNQILEPRDPNSKKIAEPSWIATISKPKIEYISKHSKKS